MEIAYELSEGIATITINRPSKSNALTTAMYEEVSRLLCLIDSEPNVSVAIITGAGEKAFSAGADLRSVHVSSAEDEAWSPLRHDRFDHGLPVQKPLLAAIDGYCLAGGLELALMCDIRVATETSQFGCPEVKWGLLHGFGAYRLPHVVGLSNALNLLLTGEFVDAREAHRIGLIQEIVARDELLERTRNIARRIRDNAPSAVRMTKELAMMSEHLSLRDELSLYKEYNRIITDSAELREGLGAFADARRPEYRVP